MADLWIDASGHALIRLAIFLSIACALLMALWGDVENIEVDEP